MHVGAPVSSTSLLGLVVSVGPCTQVASILHSLDAEGSAESEAVLEEAFATTEGLVEPVEEDEAEARLLGIRV